MIKEKSLEALSNLRTFMSDKGLTALYLSGNDPHLSETAEAHFNLRPFLSGFTGSMAEILITHTQAYLWCDGRYFLQAKEELYPWFEMIGDDPFPSSFSQWLVENLSGGVLGLEPSSVSVTFVSKLRDLFTQKEPNVTIEFISVDWMKIWKNRPAQKFGCIQLFNEFSEDTQVKLSKIRMCMQDHKVDFLIISALEDIAWIVNLRGEDIPASRVFYSYLIVGSSDCYLFVCRSQLSVQLKDYLRKNQIKYHDYEDFFPYLKNFNGRFCLDAQRTCCKVLLSLNKTAQVFYQTNPSTLMKMIKGSKEIQGFQTAHLKEGVVWLKLWVWLREKCKHSQKIKETDIERQLAYLRKQQKGFVTESFSTISAWGASGAVVHYKATEKRDNWIQGDSLLLLDAGAHYETGTTDMTRTFALFGVTAQMRRDYTCVLKGLIRLSRVHFPLNTYGEHLDVLARLDLWKEGLDYAHSTGHGVGYCLNVHEGPSRIGRSLTAIPLKPRMVFSQEPGLYREGFYGIRLENLVWVSELEQADKKEKYLCFKTFSLFPFDLRLIEEALLDQEEIQWLSEYHSFVYESLSPLVDREAEELLLESKSYFLRLAQKRKNCFVDERE